MNIYIRVDASREMGSGHVIRCLTLAEEFKKGNHKVEFICRKLDGDLFEFISQKGFEVHELTNSYTNKIKNVTKHSNWLTVSWEQDVEQTLGFVKNDRVDWLFIDNYAIDYNWERAIRPYVNHIMVIDDLADRKHDCDILLDQNYYIDQEKRYSGLVSNECITLLGPQYALLRNEFRQKKPFIRKDLNRILVFMGGSDPTNETEKVIEGFLQLKNNLITLDVIVGKLNPHANVIKNICESFPNINFYTHIENISELMIKADFAFGAGGSTTWERCSLGLPTAVVTIALNQESLTKDIALTGSVISLGKSQEVTSDDVAKVIDCFLKNLSELKKMSENCLDLVNVYGVRKVVEQCALVK